MRTAVNTEVISPNGESVRARQGLVDRFADRMVVHPGLTRKVVTWQGNRSTPGMRWFKYTEGFPGELVSALIREEGATSVLDPFAGMGTTPLTAAAMGIKGVGIEVMPVGVRVAKALYCAGSTLQKSGLERGAAGVLSHIAATGPVSGNHMYQHLSITAGAFPERTEHQLARAKQYIAGMDDPEVALMLDFACMCVLEDVSYTVKSGQFLRWDRCAKKSTAKTHKGTLPDLSTALKAKLDEIIYDLDAVKGRFGGGVALEIIHGTCLAKLREFDHRQFDAVVTSPPYANRYDYTRIYALELAWLGLGEEEIKGLRDAMLTATVENRSKLTWMIDMYGMDPPFIDARIARDQNRALEEVVRALRRHAEEMPNTRVINMLEDYFLEMAVVIWQLARVVKPGAAVYMVNDNVQYLGEPVPVDLILSDFAEQAGFQCKQIWTFAKGKGNPSQQMGKYGRKEVRKCVYHWVRRGKYTDKKRAPEEYSKGLLSVL